VVNTSEGGAPYPPPTSYLKGKRWREDVRSKELRSGGQISEEVDTYLDFEKSSSRSWCALKLALDASFDWACRDCRDCEQGAE